MTDHDTYRVPLLPDAGVTQASAQNFRRSVWLAATAEEVFSRIHALVHEVITDMHANAETPPAPLADRAYIARSSWSAFPPGSHRALVLRAAEEGVSLNWLQDAIHYRIDPVWAIRDHARREPLRARMAHPAAIVPETLLERLQQATSASCVQRRGFLEAHSVLDRIPTRYD